MNLVRYWCWLLVSLSGILLASTLSAQVIHWPQDTFQTLVGQELTPHQIRSQAATVVLFMDPECPVTQKYGATLRKLQQEWQDKDVTVVAVYPVVGIDHETIAEFAQDYRYNFTHLPDPQQKLAKQLQANTTPEAFLLDSLGQVRYRGAIDNWFYELGRYRRVVTEHYVADALTAYLQGNPISVSKTEAIGCLIGTSMVEESHHGHH
ncbi:redoxin domain-containing protein [Tunicatimonas pelagia]|uniref:redoxin domain-containing protein n=1 Tax=Tunicatimonas pelagia TaxID=931531 RepID=UPI002666EF21|nr:redoxin domain-containing protein [Tunicatimonas pelagia]WKN45020.1 redoxin domain-containing protein [Tunicatimonas pelagia]